MRRKQVRDALWAALTQAYVALDQEGDDSFDWNCAYYYGLRKAYSIETGVSDLEIGIKVAGWYVQHR